MTECPCPDCHGARLKPEILSVTVGGKCIIKQVQGYAGGRFAGNSSMNRSFKKETVR